jgi:hypothetical protein
MANLNALNVKNLNFLIDLARALGNFNDDSVLLRLAAEYIEKFKV